MTRPQNGDGAQRAGRLRSSASARRPQRATRPSASFWRTSRTTCARLSPRLPATSTRSSAAWATSPSGTSPCSRRRRRSSRNSPTTCSTAARIDAGDLELKSQRVRSRRGGASVGPRFRTAASDGACVWAWRCPTSRAWWKRMHRRCSAHPLEPRVERLKSRRRHDPSRVELRGDRGYTLCAGQRRGATSRGPGPSLRARGRRSGGWHRYWAVDRPRAGVSHGRLAGARSSPQGNAEFTLTFPRQRMRPRSSRKCKGRARAHFNSRTHTGFWRE